MRKIVLILPDALYSELETASAGIHEMGFGPQRFAQEILEADLATRRLPRVPPSVQCGRHNHSCAGRETEELVAEPEPYRVLCPEGNGE